MTIVYNQYETAPATTYSGSMQSNFFLPRTNIYGIGALSRDKIADTATRYTNQYQMLGKMYLLSDFPRISTAPKEYSWFINRGFSRNLSLLCDEEQYHDSVLGHPIAYSAANGITSALINPGGFGFADSRVHTQLGMSFMLPTSSITLFLGTAGAYVGRDDHGEEQFCDTIWTYTGPFQSRYKNVFRIKSPSVFTPFPGKSEVSWSIALGASTRRNTLGYTASYNAISYLCYVTTSQAPDNEIPDQFAIALDGPLAGTDGNLIETFLKYSGDTRYPPNSWTVSYMSKEVLYFGYFGFGDDFGNFPRGYTQLEVAFGGKSMLMKYPLSIRGWRYGISSGLPQFSMAAFRSGRFGQFRDMLEQRPYTKFYNNNTAFASPVTVNFKSGTQAYTYAQDYVTATNPDYNPRDSGIYDYEYRSGFGFVDIEPTD